MDPTKIIKGVVATEKAIKLREEQNIITLVVDRKANKQKVSEAMLKMFGVKAVDVRVVNTVKGYKKAYVKLPAEKPAVDIATEFGVM